MKIHDPVLPYSKVMAGCRSAHAASHGERFRLGSRGFPPRRRDPEVPVAAVGASTAALSAEQLESAVGYVGRAGGILADLGFDVSAIGAAIEHGLEPSLVVWVGSASMPIAERSALKALGVPVVVVCNDAAVPDDWKTVNPDDQHDDLAFTRELVAAIGEAVGPLGLPGIAAA